MEKRRKAKKRFSALTSFLLALALLAGTLGALPAECFAAQPEKAAFHSTALTVFAWAAAPRWSCNTGIN